MCECKLFIVWNWFIAKINLIKKNIYFVAIKNGGNSKWCLRLQQKPVIKFFISGKCKPFNIYIGKCNVYGQANSKIFTNGLNIASGEKTVYWVENQWLSGKEKVPGVAV